MRQLFFLVLLVGIPILTHAQSVPFIISAPAGDAYIKIDKSGNFTNTKEVAKVVKERAKRVVEESKDVVEAAKKVVKQSKDVVSAAKTGQSRKGRKPAAKK
jgi:hypothetical protein